MQNCKALVKIILSLQEKHEDFTLILLHDLLIDLECSGLGCTGKSLNADATDMLWNDILYSWLDSHIMSSLKNLSLENFSMPDVCISMNRKRHQCFATTVMEIMHVLYRFLPN